MLSISRKNTKSASAQQINERGYNCSVLPRVRDEHVVFRRQRAFGEQPVKHAHAGPQLLIVRARVCSALLIDQFYAPRESPWKTNSLPPEHASIVGNSGDVR